MRAGGFAGAAADAVHAVGIFPDGDVQVAGFLAGRAGSSRQGESADAETSYIAPTRTQVMMKNSVVEYEYYLIVDNIDKIRKQIYKIHTKSKKS